MTDREHNDRAFLKLVDDYLDRVWEMWPVSATAAGVHNYDHDMDHVDRASRENFLTFQDQTLRALEEIERRDGLSGENQIDLQIFASVLRGSLITDKDYNRYLLNPCLYPYTALYGCFILILRDFAPPELRYRSLIARLKEIPRYLMEARDNLRLSESIPALWREMAVTVTASGQRLFSKIIMDLSGQIAGMKNDLLSAATLASKAFKNYQEFLEEELVSKPNRSYACGEEYFNFILREEHRLPYDAGELERIGREQVELISDRLSRAAAAFGPGRDWPQLIDEIKSQTPAAEELSDAYRREVARSRAFLAENDLVSLPADESLAIIDTPDFYRSTLPYAAYMPPGAFEKKQQGFFWVTPVNKELSPDEHRNRLAGHSHAAIELRSVHEGFPGHHLQMVLANGSNSKVRRLFMTDVYVEGWALYCEEMMNEAGYYRHPGAELIQLKDQLWRACRIVIDARLHTERCSFDEAVDMLVTTARLERPSAVAEVRRYTQSPTQPMSYLIGKIELEKIITAIGRAKPGIHLKEIHDRLLTCGAIAPTLVSRALLGTNPAT